MHCEHVKASLGAVLDYLQDFVSGDVQFLGTPLECFELALAEQMDRVESMQDAMAATLAEIASQGAECSHSSLAASCAQCLDDPGPLALPGPSGAVRVRQGGAVLRRVAATFRTAARTATEPALRERYAALAERLRGLPAARILDVTAPASGALGQSYVGLRRTDLPDDGRSPLAVVVTLVRNRKGCMPALTGPDRALLEQAFEAFKNTLAPGRER
jgi:hypothetical protein